MKDGSSNQTYIVLLIFSIYDLDNLSMKNSIYDL